MNDALHALENLLLCTDCNTLVQHPCTLGGCEHYYCSACASAWKGRQCKACQAWAYPKEMQESRQLHNLARLCKKLRIMLDSETSSDNIDDCDQLEDLVMPSATSLESGGESELTTNTESSQSSAEATDRTSESSERVEDVIKAVDEAVNALDNLPLKPTRRSKRPDVRSKQANVYKANTRWGTKRPSTELDEKENTFTEPCTSCPREKGKQVSFPLEGSSPSNCELPGVGSECSDQPVLHRKTAKLRSATHTAGKEKESNEIFVKPKPIVKSSATPRRSLLSMGNETFVAEAKTQKLHQRKPAALRICTAAKKLKRNAKGETLLHQAVDKGSVRQVKELIKEGAPVNVKDNAGWTPLHDACSKGYLAIVTELLNAGAWINTPGFDNETALHEAVACGHVKVASLLMKRGARPSLRNRMGSSAYEYANNEELRKALQTAAQVEPLPAMIPTNIMNPNPVPKPVIAVSGLNSSQTSSVQKWAKVIDARIVRGLSEEVTHVVTCIGEDGCVPRTFKYLHSVAMGKWVVGMAWLEYSAEVGSPVSEEAFEVSGCSTTLQCDAPRRSRLNSWAQLPRLFDGMRFFLNGSFTAPREDIQQLISFGAGVILHREPRPDTIDEWPNSVPYHVTSEDHSFYSCGLYVLTDAPVTSPYRMARLRSVTSQWLMDSAASFSLLDS